MAEINFKNAAPFLLLLGDMVLLPIVLWVFCLVSLNRAIGVFYLEALIVLIPTAGWVLVNYSKRLFTR